MFKIMEMLDELKNLLVDDRMFCCFVVYYYLIIFDAIVKCLYSLLIIK